GGGGRSPIHLFLPLIPVARQGGVKRGETVRHARRSLVVAINRNPRQRVASQEDLLAPRVAIPDGETKTCQVRKPGDRARKVRSNVERRLAVVANSFQAQAGQALKVRRCKERLQAVRRYPCR